MCIIDLMIKVLYLLSYVLVVCDIVEIGNILVVLIFLVMECMLCEGEVFYGGFALFIGFGVGLSYVVQVVILF